MLDSRTYLWRSSSARQHLSWEVMTHLPVRVPVRTQFYAGDPRWASKVGCFFWNGLIERYTLQISGVRRPGLPGQDALRIRVQDRLGGADVERAE